MATNATAQSVGSEIVRVRRRQTRAPVTREKILHAATAEFAHGGFDGTTTRSIAARAKVQHGLLVYYFQSKLGVWQAVMERALRHYHDEFCKCLAQLEGADELTLLRACQASFIRVMAQHPELNWLSLDVGADADRANSLVAQIIGEDIEFTIDLVRKAQRMGCYVDGDPYHLHYAYVCTAGRIFSLSNEIERTLGVPAFDEAFVERHIKLCERLFFRNLPEA